MVKAKEIIKKAIEVVTKAGEIFERNWDGSQKVYDSLGREVPDPTPIEVPIKVKGREERIADIVKGTLSRHMAERGMETFEEANDFDVDPEDMDGFIYPDDFTPAERVVRRDGYQEENPTVDKEKKVVEKEKPAVPVA